MKLNKWLVYTNPATWILMIGGALGGVIYSAGKGATSMMEVVEEREETSTRRKTR